MTRPKLSEIRARTGRDRGLPGAAAWLPDLVNADVVVLLGAVDALRALADSLMEQGDEHVPGCMGQADCAACVHHDLMQAIGKHIDVEG